MSHLATLYFTASCELIVTIGNPEYYIRSSTYTIMHMHSAGSSHALCEFVALYYSAGAVAGTSYACAIDRSKTGASETALAAHTHTHTHTTTATLMYIALSLATI